MPRMISAIAILLLNLVTTVLFAQGQLSPDDAQALQQVQSFLNTPADRNAAILASPAAMGAHTQGVATVGNENIEELYAVSSIVMGDLTRLAGGDPFKMQQLLAQARTNPAAFYNSLSPASIAAIKKLAKKVKPRNS